MPNGIIVNDNVSKELPTFYLFLVSISNGIIPYGIMSNDIIFNIGIMPNDMTLDKIVSKSYILLIRFTDMNIIRNDIITKWH